MASKKDFFYFESGSYTTDYNSYIYVAGGQVKIPLWLAMTTWAILAGVLVIVGFLVAIFLPYPEGFSPAEPDGGRFAFVAWAAALSIGLPCLIYILGWAAYGVSILVKEWRKAFRGSRVS